MSAVRNLTFLILLFTVSLAFGQVTEEWVARHDGGWYDHAYALDLDAEGNVYVTGGSHTQTDYDYCTIKYDSRGNTVWRVYYDGDNHVDIAKDVAVDAEGNVYVTGRSSTHGTLRDWATVKYNSDGIRQWVQRYNQPGYNGDDEAVALALDAEGNIYVTGRRYNGGWDDYMTVKYSPGGGVLWMVFYNGPSAMNDRATDIAVDDVHRHVYVTGKSTTGPKARDDCLTIAYHMDDGRELWWDRYSRGYRDEGDALAVDDSGSVYLTGWSWGANNNEYLTIKYAFNGTRRWVRHYDSWGGDHGSDVAVDADYNVYVTGWSAEDYGTVKYDPHGNELWVARYNSGEKDSASAVAVDAFGNVYVTGMAGQPGYEFVTIKYDSDGNQLWLVKYTADNFDIAYDLAVDASGNVYVTGEGGSNVPDYITIKYRQQLIEVEITPINPPIKIPPEGGDFSFDWTITNMGDTSVIVDTWTMAIWPDGSYHGPLKLFDSLYVPAQGDTGFYGVNQEVDGSWPGGAYRYLAYVGYYPDTTFDSSYFDFTKLLCLTTWVEPLDTIFRAPLDTLRFDLWVYNCDSLSIPVWGAIQGRAYGCDGGEVVKGPKTRRLASNLQPGDTLYGSFYLVVRYRPEEIMSHAGVEILVGPEVPEWVDSTCYVVKVIQPWSPYAKAMGPEGPEILEWGPIEELTPTEALNATVTSLSRNYPNPFNANTEIIYSLAEAGDVSLTTYNLGGQLLETLVYGHQDVGEHRVTWDASDHSSGIYFYKLTTGDFTETRRMTLLK